MTSLKAPALDPATVEPLVGYDYPGSFNEPCSKREWREMGNALGLTQFGVNLTVLPPGEWSSQRHWHMNEDEFVYILDGEVVLVTDDGEQILRAGMAAGFPAGKRDGHHLINRSARPASFIEMGTRAKSENCEYSDIDMTFDVRDGVERFLHKNGEPY